MIFFVPRGCVIFFVLRGCVSCLKFWDQRLNENEGVNFDLRRERTHEQTNKRTYENLKLMCRPARLGSSKKHSAVNCTGKPYVAINSTDSELRE